VTVSAGAPSVDVVDDAREAARSAGLRYVSDQRAGILRRRAGRGFVYTDADGARVRDTATMERIRSLAIPPAWTDVWICPEPSGHLQATGRDARGRKQYRYHPRWREVRDEAKYGRLANFGEALPAIRGRVEEDLARPGLPREKVLAAAVRLLDRSLIRVGNEAYARDNGSFGLTTLRDEHVNVSGSRLRFRFRGKGGRLHAIDVADRRLAGVVKRCQELPGEELFQYVDDEGEPEAIESGDVNAYLAEVAGREFTAKDFRTWGGTARAAEALRDQDPASSEADGKRKVAEAIREVAQHLGNTPSVCRACYVHPAVIEAYVDGSLHDAWDRAARRRRPVEGLEPEEVVLLDLLRDRAVERAA
jgi:DNA topoisomerase-1